jgi:hypothetical protein
VVRTADLESVDGIDEKLAQYSAILKDRKIYTQNIYFSSDNVFVDLAQAWRCQRVMDEVMKNQGMRLDSRPAPLGCRAGYSNACPWFVELEIG